MDIYFTLIILIALVLFLMIIRVKQDLWFIRQEVNGLRKMSNFLLRCRNKKEAKDV